MQKHILHISTKNDSGALVLAGTSEMVTQSYLELLFIFGGMADQAISILPLQPMSEEIREKYNDYLQRYKDSQPQFFKFSKILDKVDIGDHFFLSFEEKHTTEQTLYIANLIEVHNKESNDEDRAVLFQKFQKQQNEIFGDVLEKYDISAFDSSSRINIGEHDREKRICRFCGNGKNTETKVSFVKKAHAFSEATGNKGIVLNEECDDCNEMFGQRIEEDFIKYIDIHRVFFEVKGKNGVPQIKFENGSMSRCDTKENTIILKSYDITEDKSDDHLNITMKSEHLLQSCNIYKALCKFALSVMDKNELQYLKETIKWISTDNETEIKLPKVATLLENSMYVDKPSMMVNVRKDNNNDLSTPHVVCEFKFKSLIFVFPLPFSSKDTSDFLGEETYNNIFKVFKHYSFVKKWTFHDFSSTKKAKFQFKLNFNKN